MSLFAYATRGKRRREGTGTMPKGEQKGGHVNKGPTNQPTSRSDHAWQMRFNSTALTTPTNAPPCPSELRPDPNSQAHGRDRTKPLHALPPCVLPNSTGRPVGAKRPNIDLLDGWNLFRPETLGQKGLDKITLSLGLFSWPWAGQLAGWRSPSVQRPMFNGLTLDLHVEVVSCELLHCDWLCSCSSPVSLLLSRISWPYERLSCLVTTASKLMVFSLPGRTRGSLILSLCIVALLPSTLSRRSVTWCES